MTADRVVVFQRVAAAGFLCTAVLAACADADTTSPAAEVDLPEAAGEALDGSSITVDAADIVGASSAIGDFLAIQGSPSVVGHGNAASDAWVYEAWRQVVVRIGDVYLFDDAGSGVSVRRNASGELELDFTPLDDQLSYITEFLGARPYFSIMAMPQALSSNAGDADTYPYYAPSSYPEWEQIVSQTVRHLQQRWGLAGASYLVWNEPETFYYWRGYPWRQPNELQLLADYVELYVHTWHAVKDADPTAQVGGPMVISHSSELNAQLGASWGMDDFLRELAAYNAQYPDDAVTLDEVVWQDYNWVQDDRLADGVDYLRGALAQYGFPSDTPQVLLGWNTNYDDLPLPCGTESLQERASFFASNVIEQLAPGGVRGLARAYAWPFDDDSGCAGMAWLTAPVPERASTLLDGDRGVPERYPAVTESCKRPVYAAAQLLRTMMDDGSLIRAHAEGGLGLQVLATTDGASRVRALLANHTDVERAVNVRFANLPWSRDRAIETIQRIDAAHSAACQGIEAGLRARRQLTGRAATVPLRLPPYSVAQVTLDVVS